LIMAFRAVLQRHIPQILYNGRGRVPGRISW